MDAVRGLCLRPAHQRAAKYRPARVTAQLATTLCAANVPMSRLIQNRAMRTRGMRTLSSAYPADTEMPSWQSTRAQAKTDSKARSGQIGEPPSMGVGLIPGE